MSIDLYAVLEISPEADFLTLKKAYYKQAKKCHPDHFANSPEKTEEFKRLVAAFNTLSDPDRRAAYDRSRNIHTQTSAGFSVMTKCEPVLDSEADDTLEELVVGNKLDPERTSLLTLFQDMRSTEIFIAWRSAETLYRTAGAAAALKPFQELVRKASGNILYQVYLARCYARTGSPFRAIRHYRIALRIGITRSPAQPLYRVRRELDAMMKRKTPFLLKLKEMFTQENKGFYEPESDIMIKELNHAYDWYLKRQKAKELAAGQERRALMEAAPTADTDDDAQA